MNNWPQLLVMSNVGCYIDGQCMNADDICLCQIIVNQEPLHLFLLWYMWSDYKKTMYRKLRVAFSRRVLGLSYRSSASTMYTTHNINNMEALLRRSIYSFIERLMDSSNMIIYSFNKA